MFSILGADGKEYGPVAADKVQAWITGGRANLQTKARREGETEWKTLGDFAEFNAAPPALEPSLASPASASSTAVPAAPATNATLAGRGRRLGGALVDGLLVWLCRIPIFFAVLPVFKEAIADPQALKPEMISQAIIGAMSETLPLLAVLATLQITLLCVRSQSVGKLLFGMRIVSVQTGEPGGPVRAFVLRGMLVWCLEQIPILGFLFWIVDACFIFRDDKRCIHDLIAGTQVVNA